MVAIALTWLFFSSSTNNDLFDIANNSAILSAVNDLSDITYDNVLMSLCNTTLTIVGLKNTIDSTTTVYISSKIQKSVRYNNLKSQSYLVTRSFWNSQKKQLTPLNEHYATN